MFPSVAFGSGLWTGLDFVGVGRWREWWWVLLGLLNALNLKGELFVVSLFCFMVRVVECGTEFRHARSCLDLCPGLLQG